MLELGRLAEQVDKLAAVLDGQRVLGRGEPGESGRYLLEITTYESLEDVIRARRR